MKVLTHLKKLLKICKKNNQIIVTNEKINEIKSLYNIECNENMEEFKVDRTEKGDSMLKNIFIIISSKNKNRLKKLNLKDNKIEDPSILSRIQFNFLEELDLSINNIKNLNFLKGIKAKKLVDLYLDHNNIKDISALYNIKEFFPCLKNISLYNNNFIPENSYFNLIQYLQSKNIKVL